MGGKKELFSPETSETKQMLIWFTGFVNLSGMTHTKTKHNSVMIMLPNELLMEVDFWIEGWRTWGCMAESFFFSLNDEWTSDFIRKDMEVKWAANRLDCFLVISPFFSWLFNILIGWISKLTDWESDQLSVKLAAIRQCCKLNYDLPWEMKARQFMFECQMSSSIQAKGALSIIVLFISSITVLLEASS